MPAADREHRHEPRGRRGDEQIQRSLQWLGIDWDGPVTFQLDAMDRCRELGQQLLAEGKAYEDEGAIRFRMPDEGVTAWDDAVLGPDRGAERRARGRRDRPRRRAADLQLREPGRGHGRPDHARHPRPRPHLEHAEAAPDPRRARPRAAGLRARPDVLGDDGKKLSKRHGATSVEEFRAAGYLPEALMNFLALLGWAPDGETTIMPPDELVARFSLDRVGASPATLDYQKLDWMNGVYLRALLARGVRRPPRRVPRRPRRGRRSACGRSVPLVQEKIERLAQYPEFAGFLFERPDPQPGDPEILAAAAEALERLEPFTRRGDRAGAARARRAARPEAAAGVSADPGGGHRLDGLTGPLREHRVPGPRGDARAAQARQGGIGLGRASGSSAR